MTSPTSDCPLSVVVGTLDAADADLARCLAALRPQLEAIGGELLVADGSPGGPHAPGFAVRLPGADIFALRAQAAAQARGRVIAFTEDHCVPAGDWCAAILRAHDEHPHVAAIGGAVVNASDERLVDRANFLVTFGPFLPPLPQRHRRRPVPPANVSIKHESLAEYDLTPGLLELEIVPHLHRVGHLLLDDRIRVAHVQSHGAAGTPAMHFHNGRVTTSIPPRDRPPAEVLRRGARALAPPARPRAALARGLGRPPGRPRRLAAAPWIAALLVSHAAGEVAGSLRGPGTSPERLH